MALTASQIVIAEARALIDAPYRHRGRGPVGWDCLGVVLNSAWSTGLVPRGFDFTDYTENVADYILEQHLDESGFLDRLSKWDLAQPGDILLQRFRKSLPASHLIIISTVERGGWWGIHASRRGVVEQRIAHFERCVAAYRLKEVAHG